MQTIIHIIRHGEVHNPDHILYGRLPRFGLSERGREQARAAAAFLKDRPLAAVYSSPLLRARQTAALIAAPHGLTPQRTTLLHEVHMPYDGTPIAEMEAMHWAIFSNVQPGYETPADLLARLRRWIDRARRSHAGQEIAAVTHGDIVLSARFWVQGETFTDERKNQILYPGTASLTSLTFRDGVEMPEMTTHLPY